MTPARISLRTAGDGGWPNGPRPGVRPAPGGFVSEAPGD